MEKQAMSLPNDDKLRICPLGGCGEIGMNITLVMIKGAVYIIDCGVLFADAGLVGVDAILPDVRFLTDNNIKPEGWLFTHGHEDHIGALPYLFSVLPAPIWTTEFTAELIRGKFFEVGIKDYTINIWHPGTPLQIPHLTVTPFTVNHSIPAATGIFIESEYGNVLHTGDFRIDYNPPEKSMTHDNIRKAVANKTVHMMMADSTNSMVEGTDHSESELTPEFVKLMNETTGALVMASFASNIWRIQTVIDAAEQTGRKVFLLGRSLHKNYETAVRTHMLPVKPGLVIEESELKNIPRHKLCVLSTGSQGEMYSGLYRMANGTFPSFQITFKDTVVFSARPIPGNEKTLGALMNQLSRSGANIVTSKQRLVHVSGHGFQDDLIECIKAAKPQYFMPLHGEYRFLRNHIALAEKCGIDTAHCLLVENGDIICISKEEIYIEDHIKAGRDYVCQGCIIPSNGDIYRTRMNLARNGIVFVSCVMNSNRTLASKPHVISQGVPIQEGALSSNVPAIFRAAMNSLSDRKTIQEGMVAEEMRYNITRLLENWVGYKCMVSVSVSRVN